MFLTKFLFSALLCAPLISCDPLLPDAPDNLVGPIFVPKDTNLQYLLPDHAVPFEYEIKLTPSLVENDFTFEGECTIYLNVTKANNTLYLHAKDLEIDQASIELEKISETWATLDSWPVNSVSLNNVTDILSIQFNKTIPKDSNNLKLYLKYKGKLNDGLRGFYRSSYINDEGEREWMASTHFEPVGARQAFPCWDEPAYKATFQITIYHNQRYRALSNMEIDLSSPISGTSKMYTQFEKSPMMSTYLVAFVVANFDFKSHATSELFKVWARKNAIRHGKFAVEFGEKELRALENFTNIPQKDIGFTKMDLVALPSLSAGAMENWGLITFRESGLLVEENVTSTSSMEAVAKVISHELAHQWFGNLVSPKWWNYTWLNEGFANYFQYYITDQVTNNSWHLMDRFVVEALQGAAFTADGVNTSHPMDANVFTQTEIGSIFDDITYSKAGSVIRMFANVLGPENFQKALQSYLTKRKFSVSTSAELIHEFANVTGTYTEKLKFAFANWTTTPGYPVLNVTVDPKTNSALLSQTRFYYNKNQASNETYWIPFDYATDQNKSFNRTIFDWLEPNEKTKNISIPKDLKWIIFNKQQFGYYRVNYDAENWKSLTSLLMSSHPDVHVVNRAQLIDDALNLARSGHLNYQIALPLIGYLVNETEYVPWYSAWRGISHVTKMLANNEEAAKFKNHILSLTKKLIEVVKFNESNADTHLQKLQRVTLIDKTCSLGLEECRTFTNDKLKKWIQNSNANPLSSDLKNVILCSGIRSADESTWNDLLKKYKAEKDSDILSALACTSNTGILNNYLLMTFNGSLINVTTEADKQNNIFKAVYSKSDEGVNVALDFIINNPTHFSGGDVPNNDTLKTYFAGIGDFVTTQEQLDKIKQLPKKLNLSEEIIAVGVQRANENLNWISVKKTDIQEFLKTVPDSAVAFAISTLLLVLSVAFSVLY